MTEPITRHLPTGPEGVAAQAAVELESEQQRSRRSARRVRRAQEDAERKVLDRQRRAARFRAAAGMVQGGLAAAGGALRACASRDDRGAGQKKGAASVADGLSGLVGAGLGIGADRAERRESHHAQGASHRAEEARSHAEDAAQAGRLQDRAFDHAGRILDARLAAERALLRG